MKRIIKEADAKDLTVLSQMIRDTAINEIGEEYSKHIRTLFGREVLDYAKSLVINLPGSCFSNCEYCIDKKLRSHVTNYDEFLCVCERVLEEKADFKEISVTGGTLPPVYFNRLMEMIRNHCPEARITWNTNGAYVNEQYDVSDIQYINLHRNSADDVRNRYIFRTAVPILSIEEAKRIFGDKLCIRVTVDEAFELNDYLKFETPLYLNRLLPGTEESEKRFNEVLDRLYVSEDADIRRRNRYLNGSYQNIPVRLCLGDRLADHVEGRYPMWLNVVIIHRSGIVCGSWYEDDKFLFKAE